MLCNFEDGAFEVMHELDSFPASDLFLFFHRLFILRDSLGGECFNGFCWAAALYSIFSCNPKHVHKEKDGLEDHEPKPKVPQSAS